MHVNTRARPYNWGGGGHENFHTYKGGQRTFCASLRKGKVPCLPSVTGFNSKVVFDLAEHPTLL